MMLHRPGKWIGSRYGTDKPSIWLAEGDSVTKANKHTLLLKPLEKWEQLKIGVFRLRLRQRKDGLYYIMVSAHRGCIVQELFFWI